MTTRKLIDNWLAVWKLDYSVDPFIKDLSNLVTGYYDGSDYYDNRDDYELDLSDAKELHLSNFLSKKNSIKLNDVLSMPSFEPMWENFLVYIKSNNQVTPTKNKFIGALLDNSQFATLASDVLTRYDG